MSKLAGFIFGVLLCAGLIKAALASHTGFDQNNLLDDGTFINKETMSAAEIQDFLKQKGSFLKDFSEGGRTAAQIIWDAAHGNIDDAAGSWGGKVTIDSGSGTINPQVILVTLQKEQSLISKTAQDDNALKKAMGYGCPDSGSCDATYAGFTKQVNWGAAQLRFNYERASGLGYTDYQVNQNQCFSDVNGTNCATFQNRATASLYRYTPHVYNGNHNFHQLFFSTYQFQLRDYDANFMGQSAGVYTLPAGESVNYQVIFKNVGRNAWSAGGSTPVRLGLDPSRSDTTPLQGSNWISNHRPAGLSADVAPGGQATFTVNLTTPLGQAPGSYRIYFQLLAENSTWFPRDHGSWVEILVPTKQEEYKADFLGQSTSVLTLPADLTYQFNVSFRNSGIKSWSVGGSTPVRVGLDPEQQGASTLFQGSNWISAARPVGLSSAVAQGESTNFSFQLKTPYNQPPGTYRVYFRLLAENYTWFRPENGGFWLEIRVPEVKSQWVSQTGNLQKLKRGETGTLLVTFKNTSEMPYLDSGSAPVRLGVDKNWSCCGAALQANNWLSSTRITTATQGIVQPNQNATFTFNITVPSTMPLGLHEFHARLVQENRSWFEGDEGHVWWRVEVVE
ncbi:hypothetical protein HYU72_02725 [Candidatus Berkelbacteria bacterium]|nr:hypothetical protein [Candidatus Berkelbacteria bacterium]